MQNWTIGSFVIADDEGVTPRLVGLLSSGIALDERRPVDGTPTWHLTHVATGLRVVVLLGAFGEVIGPADEIAACTDWSFSTLPAPREARDALIEIMRLYPGLIVGGSGKVGTDDDVRRVQSQAVA